MPISPKFYINIWPKSRHIKVYMIKSAKIYIFSKYVGSLQDLCSPGAKANKVNVDFWQNQVLHLNDNISLYQPADMLLEAVLVIMESKHLMY